MGQCRHHRPRGGSIGVLAIVGALLWAAGLFFEAVGDWQLSRFVVGPAVMSWLLIRVSGKALLERNLRRRRTGYDEYIARTSGFFPRPPKQTTTVRDS